ncbi:hypothetical protein B5V00_00855 [Geothermobacter hydrogeniphilus]|uniref:16S rRNA (uracil(1498)-N(3))-methyltransferase n=1 Tax=Geothermobacter hydrogeniphilus TaxID=1969733 RepID=A0A1X0YEN7_9BACT|nr:hypothetical protein B5V00_00855 [Geothermobacter hydrogeniphilus]
MIPGRRRGPDSASVVTARPVLPPRCCNSGGHPSRLLLPVVPVAEEPLVLDGTAVERLRLWRARPGEILTFVDPCQTAWRGRLERDGSCWRVVPFQSLKRNPAGPLRIDLFQALPQRERFELVLEKATELGVGRLIPYQSERSISLAERDARQKKSHRWPELVLRAARQCRRSELPELYTCCGWNEALDMGSRADLRLMLYEGGCSQQMGEALAVSRAESLALLIGPEGGFSDVEVAAAVRRGFQPVSLGPRLLRTETAAIAAIAVAQACLGDFR